MDVERQVFRLELEKLRQFGNATLNLFRPITTFTLMVCQARFMEAEIFFFFFCILLVTPTSIAYNLVTSALKGVCRV